MFANKQIATTKIVAGYLRERWWFRGNTLYCQSMVVGSKPTHEKYDFYHAFSLSLSEFSQLICKMSVGVWCAIPSCRSET